MAHIACLTTGLTGVFNASLEVVSRLQKDGHRVTYLCTPQNKDRLVGEGFESADILPINVHPAPKLPHFGGPLSWFKKLIFKASNAQSRKQAALSSLGMEAFSDTLQRLNPDIVLIDMELHEHIITAVTLDFRVVLLSQWFSGWKRRGLPPIHTDIVPGKGIKGTLLGIKWAWLNYQSKQWIKILRRKILDFGADRYAVLLTYARENKFPLNELQKLNWPPPFTYKTIPVLSMTAYELEFPHDARPGLSYIGPMVYLDRKETSVGPATNKTLQKVFDLKKLEKKSLIYCSVSSMRRGDTSFSRNIIEAVKDQPGWILILGLGGLIDPVELGTIPENVYAFKWVPQLEVLKHADCSVNHGGIHTINECIHFKVPMVVYSGQQYDQNGCAARIAYHGVGLMSDKDKDTPAQIRNHIQAILSDSSYAGKMEKLHQQYLMYQKEKKLESLIRQILEEQL